MTEQRKATDVLLELEKNLSIVLSIVRSQDLTIKVLANRVNELTKLVTVKKEDPQQPTIEAINVAPAPQSHNPSVKVHSMNQLPMEQNPNGFRRTSRPETYAGDNAYLNNSEDLRMPMQIPQTSKQNKQEVVEAVIPDEAMKPENRPEKRPDVPTPSPQSVEKKSSQKINVKQRVVDKNGKSIFLADVEIFDMDSDEKIHKSRTNGTGIWQAPLPFGGYRVVIRKREPVTKAKVESVQEITVDGTESPLQLPMLIFK